jgi:hypothetical protein
MMATVRNVTLYLTHFNNFFIIIIIIIIIMPCYVEFKMNHLFKEGFSGKKLKFLQASSYTFHCP